MIALAYAPLRGILRYVLEGGFSLDGGVENGVVERVVGRMGDPRVALLACRMIAKAGAGTQVGLPIAWAGAPDVVWWKQVAGNGTPAAIYLLGPRMAGAGDERAPPLPSRWETEHAERRQRMLPRPSLTVLEGVGLLRTRNANALRKITCHRDTKKESTYRPKGAHAGFKGLVTSMDKRGVVGTTTQEAGVTITIPVTFASLSAADIAEHDRQYTEDLIDITSPGTTIMAMVVDGLQLRWEAAREATSGSGAGDGGEGEGS